MASRMAAAVHGRRFGKCAGTLTLTGKAKPGRRVLTRTCRGDMGQAAVPLNVVVIRG